MVAHSSHHRNFPNGLQNPATAVGTLGPAGPRPVEGEGLRHRRGGNLCTSTLAPGPAGPIAANRLPALQEGVQECAARVIIEQVLTDETLRGRLDPEQAQRCQRLLDRRLHNLWRALCHYQIGGPFFCGAGAWRWTPGIPGHRWFLSSGWQEETRRLFEFPGQVQHSGGRSAPVSRGP